MRKTISLYLVLLLMLTACTKADQQEISDMEKEPISFHHYFSDTLSGGIDELVEIYNKSQQDYYIKVVPIDHEAYKTSVVESFISGSPADMNSYWAGSKTLELINYLEPIDDVYLEHGLEDVFDESVLASAAYHQGHYYLIPITQHYVNFYYNKEVFENLGLEEPANWNEFLNICEILKSNGVTPIGLGAKNKWPAQFWFDYILLRTAGADYREGLMIGDNRYTDDEVIRAITIWKELVDAGYFNEDATELDWDYDIIDPLMAGDIGMTLMGTWIMGVIESEENEGKYDDLYGVFSFPVIDETVPIVALGPVDGIILGKAGLNIEGAKDAIAEFAKIEYQVKMAEGSGAFIPNLEADDRYYNPLQLKLLKDIENSEAWAFNYDLAVDADVIDTGLNFFVEFLTFPDAYEYLLEDLDNEVRD